VKNPQNFERNNPYKLFCKEEKIEFLNLYMEEGLSILLVKSDLIASYKTVANHAKLYFDLSDLEFQLIVITDNIYSLIFKY